MTALDSSKAVVGYHLNPGVAKAREQAVVVEASQSRMCLPCWTKIHFHPEMNLHRPASKPAPAACGQFRRLGNFSHSQQPCKKTARAFLAARRHSQLHM